MSVAKIRGSTITTLSASNTLLVLPTPIAVLPIKPAVSISSAVEAESGKEGTEGDSDGEICAPLDVVASELAGDPLVPLAIKRVAQSDRSISEAIVIWNAEWSQISADEGPLADVRARVISVLKRLPPDCLLTTVAGPRLIAIPEQGYTAFLVFGSGEWSWQQVIVSNDDANSEEEYSWSWENFSSEKEQTSQYKPPDIR